ncbi:MAG: hypothetical protein ACJ8MR_08255 [Povalibacter sp.]
MATAKKKSTKKSAKKTTSNKVGWADAMRQALANKQPAGGFPDQGKPRNTAVKKVRKNAF